MKEYFYFYGFEYKAKSCKMDFSKFKAALQRANDCLDKWLALQEAASKLFLNAGNILQRLPVLSDSRNFSSLPGAPQLQQLVLAKQTRALEAVFGRLQTNLSDLEGVVRSQERQVVEVWRLVGEGAGAEACGAVQSGGSSVAQMVEAMEDVWRICRDDLAARAACLSALTHTTSPRDFQQLHGALTSYTGLLPPSGSHPVVLLQSIAAATSR
ncbi:hypothetical protein PLESTM_000226300 [Pleodorina starrii]|nr:hypothetical protein PLESTM_000226300 [Pleodorina starrii]